MIFNSNKFFVRTELKPELNYDNYTDFETLSFVTTDNLLSAIAQVLCIYDWFNCFELKEQLDSLDLDHFYYACNFCDITIYFGKLNQYSTNNVLDFDLLQFMPNNFVGYATYLLNQIHNCIGVEKTFYLL